MFTTPYSNSDFEYNSSNLLSYLRSQDLKFHQEVREKSLDVVLGMQCLRGSYFVNIKLLKDEPFLSLMVHPLLEISPENLPEAMELCNRLNVKLRIGTFEINPSDGELIFYVYHHFGPTFLNEEVVHFLMMMSFFTVDRHIKEFQELTCN